MKKSKFYGSVFVLSFLIYLTLNILNEPMTINLLLNVFILAVFNSIIATIIAFVKTKLVSKNSYFA